MKRVAIIGSGLAGLSVCYHLLSLGVEVALFDPNGIGGGASSASTGLLHPFPGRLALRSWNASAGMIASNELLQIAEAALGRKVAERTGIFRPSTMEAQTKAFQLRAREDSEAIWQESPLFGPGLWIPSGITVYSNLYLQGLLRACLGATLFKEKISSLKQLNSYDAIVIAAGFETPQFEECKHLSLKATKGQSLLCRWPQRLDYSVGSLGHISPTEDPGLCQIGSTYEREFKNTLPDLEKALSLKEKVACFYPPARDFEVVEVRAAVRISPMNGYRPIVAKVSDKAWVFTGLGSKGLLYHALLGRALAEAIVTGRDLSINVFLSHL